MPDLVDAFDLPFQEAVDFFRQKARVPTSHWTDVWRIAHSHAFMVAGAASDALLADFQASIAKALEQGTTLAEFRRDFDTIVEKHGWSYNGAPGWRARIIYETNLSTAYSAGRYAQQTTPEALKVFPYWEYVHSGSPHPRVQHLAWNGLTLRADDPFWASHYPPNGWHCGCRVRPVSRAGLGRMGKSGPDEAPEIETRPWRNPKTGEVHRVPVGIDPGFDYNPGLAWKKGAKYLPVTLDDADHPGGADRTPAEDVNAEPAVATPGQLASFMAHPRGEIGLGRIAAELQDALNLATDVVRLSAQSLRKERHEHPDMTEADYAALPGVLEHPDLTALQKDGRALLLKRLPGELRRGDAVAHLAIVKATREGDKAYLVSAYRARLTSVRQKLRRGKVLTGEAKEWER